MRSIASWLTGRFILFLVLMAAIAVVQSGTVRLPCVIGCGDVDDGDWISADDLERQLETTLKEAQTRLGANLGDFSKWTAAKRSKELERRRDRLGEVIAELAKEPGFLDKYRPTAIVGRYRLELEQATLNGEIGVLQAHIDIDQLKKAGRIMVPKRTAIRVTRAACLNANRAVRDYNARGYWENLVRDPRGTEAKRLTSVAAQRCGIYNAKVKRRREGLQQARERNARIKEAQRKLELQQARARSILAELKSPEFKNTIADIATKAALALMAIIMMPYVIRTFLYYVLAPLAQMCPAIRLHVGEGTPVPVPLSAPSRVSHSVRLGDGEELLVRQGYLQTTSTEGTKATRWLLDYWHPFSSLASGLAFLTRIRGKEEATTISATRDGFAELTQIDLPAGAVCILHPRALVAVVQPVGSPIPIRSHWRLFSLNAWLTLQLRYFSFHGPGHLIVMGGRGIRVEQAESGRVFAQDQLVGFSADLAYSVTRTETFAPYLFGREPLLKDKVEAGSGILVIEEAPLSMRRGEIRRGLEGMADAGMKALGL